MQLNAAEMSSTEDFRAEVQINVESEMREDRGSNNGSVGLGRRIRDRQVVFQIIVVIFLQFIRHFTGCLRLTRLLSRFTSKR